jgi:hypothetical protein
MCSSALRLYTGCSKLCPDFFFVLHICDKYKEYKGLLYLFWVEWNERPFDRHGGYSMGKKYLWKSMCWFPTIILSHLQFLITDFQPESYPFRSDGPFCLISGRCELRHTTF